MSDQLPHNLNYENAIRELKADCESAPTYGVTRHFGRLVMNGELRAVQVETGIKDERRLKVLLSKAMLAVASAENDVEMMTDYDISKYLEDQAKCCVTVTPYKNPVDSQAV